MALTTDQRTAVTFTAAAAATGLAAVSWLYASGISEESLGLVLRNSGRIALLLLIVVFATRPLQQLLRAPWTTKLLRRRRQLGVAFAGIHTTHLAVILYKVDWDPDLTPAAVFNLPATIVYAAMFAMLITSFGGAARAIGPRAWKVLHKLGLYILIIGFAVSQVPQSVDQLELVNGLLLGLLLLALAARVGAYVRRRRQ